MHRRIRLSQNEVKVIVSAIQSIDDKARVYLFGSRIDLNLRGGDIDILVITSKISLKEKIDILLELEDKLGERKIDLVIKTDKEAEDDPFVQSIKKIRLDEEP